MYILLLLHLLQHSDSRKILINWCRLLLLSPFLARVPLDEEPMQDQWQHGHEAQVQPVVELWRICTLLTDLLQVHSLTSGTHLQEEHVILPGHALI